MSRRAAFYLQQEIREALGNRADVRVHQQVVAPDGSTPEWHYWVTIHSALGPAEFHSRQQWESWKEEVVRDVLRLEELHQRERAEDALLEEHAG